MGQCRVGPCSFQNSTSKIAMVLTASICFISDIKCPIKMYGFETFHLVLYSHIRKYYSVINLLDIWKVVFISQCAPQVLISIPSQSLLGYGPNQMIVKIAQKSLENACLWKEWTKKKWVDNCSLWELLGGLGLIWIFLSLSSSLFARPVELCQSRWRKPRFSSLLSLQSWGTGQYSRTLPVLMSS